MVTRKNEIRVAKRLDEVGFSDIVQIRNRVLELRTAGQVVHAFHGGEPFFETPEAIKYAMMRALVENRTKYAESSGIAPLREAIADKLKTKNSLDAGIEDVMITAGGAHALYAAFQSVLDPGDDVLLFSPYWTPIRDMITVAEARPLLIPTATARRNGLTKTLEHFTTPKARAIYYNTPQNPSGVVFSRAEAEEVAAFARAHNLIVIADEAYEDLVYEGEHVSIASLPGMAERTITAYTFSKTYGMTGWRIGYAVAKEPFMTAVRKIVLYSSNGVSTPTQWAALKALALSRSMIDARREEYRQRRDLLVKGLNEAGLECETPEGAFYAFPSVTKIHKDSRRAAALLLDKAHVVTVPGVVFGAQGEGHLRFGYAVSPESIEAGLEALHRFVKG
ncbi:pyridoxal phosphate-dependent aminotransferase [Paracidobacterium acidisoli]|uniref:Aminotransferase class I/II-fold pyridoxal phosphate-dependent enzyme n=1 Tax=Paracidobacterium acidisoli TaxID=2303751 RepID=A0A372ING2_9BACT|nr:aminotransferase class I/II-fold pyridoxal phosphate-dependent enzyme [Paracidobacterium acidisoli]MBT9331937.1 aminotransferase class I/II-fold pyridoxal phosphate-dependent enzyme [Paracidobacterium acidisoli]